MGVFGSVTFQFHAGSIKSPDSRLPPSNTSDRFNSMLVRLKGSVAALR